MKKIIGIGIGIVIILLVLALSMETEPEKTVIYHITLAEPSIYNNGIFTDILQIQKGTYQFSFVPNGDSPQILSITLKGNRFSFSEDFHLNGTRHDTGISTYYTWRYIGIKDILVPEDDHLQIVINPHGNLLGSLSVDLIKT